MKREVSTQLCLLNLLQQFCLPEEFYYTVDLDTVLLLKRSVSRTSVSTEFPENHIVEIFPSSPGGFAGKDTYGAEEDPKFKSSDAESFLRENAKKKDAYVEFMKMQPSQVRGFMKAKPSQVRDSRYYEGWTFINRFSCSGRVYECNRNTPQPFLNPLFEKTKKNDSQFPV
jgi:hypothetical protein